jgi:hypothetical protein
VFHSKNALPANIRLGRKGLPGKNTLAYLTRTSVTKKMTPGAYFIKQFTALINSVHKKTTPFVNVSQFYPSKARAYLSRAP